MQQKFPNKKGLCQFNESCTKPAIDTCMNEDCGIELCSSHSVRRGEFLLCRRCEERPPKEFIERILRKKLAAEGYDANRIDSEVIRVLRNYSSVREA
jgi:hypothetical protein